MGGIVCTRDGAEVGAVAGVLMFVILKLGLIQSHWLDGTPLASSIDWVAAQAVNPFACSTLGILGSIGVTWLVSRATSPLPEAHLDKLFPSTPKRKRRPTPHEEALSEKLEELA